MTKCESRVINAYFSRDAWVVRNAHHFVGGERAASQSRWIRTTSRQLERQFLKILVSLQWANYQNDAFLSSAYHVKNPG